MPPRLLGALAGFAAAAIWGGMYVVSKYVLDVVPPLTLVLARLLVGALTLGAIAWLTGQPRVCRRELPFLALLGLVGLCVSMIAQFAGTRLSTAVFRANVTRANRAKSDAQANAATCELRPPL